MKVLAVMGLLVDGMGVLEFSDFIADFDDFFIETVLFDDGVLDDLGEDGVGLDEFEGLVFEVERGVGGTVILNIGKFEFRLWQ